MPALAEPPTFTNLPPTETAAPPVAPAPPAPQPKATEAAVVKEPEQPAKKEPTGEEKLSALDVPEIEEIKTDEDKFAVALGEKKLKKKEAPAPEKKDPPAAEEKKPEGTAEPDADAALEKEVAETTKGLTKEQQDAFKKKTYELRDARRKVKESESALAERTKLAEEKTALETKLKELEAKVAIPADDTSAKELKALRARIEEQELELAGTRLEATEIYRKEVGTPLAKTESDAVALGKDYEGLPESDILAALRLTDRAKRAAEISRIAGEMNEYDKGEFFRLAREHVSLKSKEADLKSNAKGSLERLEAERKEAEAQQSRAQKEAWSAATAKSWEKVKELVPELNPIEGADDWNATVAKAAKFANEVQFTDLDLPSQAEAMHRVATWGLLRNHTRSLESALAERDKALAERDAEIERLRGATPNAGGSVTPPPTEDPDKDLTWEQKMEKKLKSKGV